MHLSEKGGAGLLDHSGEDLDNSPSDRIIAPSPEKLKSDQTRPDIAVDRPMRVAAECSKHHRISVAVD